MADYNSSYTGVQIDTAVGNALNPDAAPTSGSNQLVKSGGVYSALQNSVPVYGMGDNLLNNWYFIGGGTGRGVFPINQRGATSISSTGYKYFIDRWYIHRSSGTTYASLSTNGLSLRSSSSDSTAYLRQIYFNEVSNFITGKKCTASALLSDGTLITGTKTYSASANTAFVTQSIGGSNFTLLSTYSGQKYFEIRRTGTTDVTIAAVKLELGDKQTLCHNEGTEANPVWILNEIPNYEDELYKCIIQPIEGTSSGVDTYANKNLATTQQLAPIETGLTASQNYTVGDLICWNNLLYKASSAIASGDTLAVGTNLTATTIEDELKNIELTGIYDISSGTASNTPDKIASSVNNSPTITSYYSCLKVRVYFQYEQSYTASSGNLITLNINNLGAKPVYMSYNTSDYATAGAWSAKSLVLMEYVTGLVSGGAWVIIGSKASTSSWGITKLEDSTSSTSTTTAATPNSVKTAYDLASAAVPQTRTVNGKALSSNISLTASDVGALASANALSELYGECDTPAATAAKTVTIPGITVLKTGLHITVRFTNAQEVASPTLNVNGLGAKSIRTEYDTKATSTEWSAGTVLNLVYNGTYWFIINKGHATTTYWGQTKLSSAIDSTSTSLAATPSAVKQAYDLAAAAVPQTRTVNSKALSSDITLSASDVGALAVDGTAVSASTLAPQYTSSAVAGGWYQFLTLNISSTSDSKKIILLIEDGYTSTSGILSIYYNRTTSGFGHGVYWLTTNMNVSDVRFIANTSDAENNSLVFYVRKRSNSNGKMTFRVLSSMTRNGTPYSISNAQWSFTSVSEFPPPCTVSHVRPPFPSVQRN